MNMLALVCYAVAILLMMIAIIHQRRDIVPGYGGTMGGEMTSGVIWLLASFVAAGGALAMMHWVFALLQFLGLWALSFLVRALIGKIPKA